MRDFHFDILMAKVKVQTPSKAIALLADKAAPLCGVDGGGMLDIFQERLIAAWGISKGKRDEVRDKSRMKGHPLGAGKEYHRGHAIPHTLGGGTDINLVAQRGSINIGAFRVLEKKAVNTPGALYFSYWEYQNLSTQTPTRVQQGLLCPRQIADIRWHNN